MSVNEHVITHEWVKCGNFCECLNMWPFGYECMQMAKYISIHICIVNCIAMNKWMYKYVHICEHLSSLGEYVNLYISEYVDINVHSSVCLHMWPCMDVSALTWVNECASVYYCESVNGLNVFLWVKYEL